MRVYISGPISGYEKGNESAFRSAAERLRARGEKPVVPHDISPWLHPEQEECPPGYAHGLDHTSACYLRGDLIILLQCDGIYMLHGWEVSVGARLEHTVAAHCGLAIAYEDAEFSG